MGGRTSGLRPLGVFYIVIALWTSQCACQHDEQLIEPAQSLANNDFDWKLVQEVFLHETQNTVFSPFSLKLLLTLLYEASANGTETQQQLSSILLRQDLDASREFYQRFLESSMTTNANYEFDIGTKIFIDKTVEGISKNYTRLLQTVYNTAVDTVSFNQSKQTTELINNWCKEATHGHITDLVQEDTIENSAIILANALFLKASWKNSFPDDKTHDRQFHVGPNVTIKTPFMRQTDLYDYAELPELQAAVLRLPYKGRAFSMNIVLPDRNSSLDNLVRSLGDGSFERMSDKFTREEVDVIIPKFRFTYGAQLNEALKSLGIRKIFTSHAALPLLSGDGKKASFEVSKILQKAGIEINEKGTLAVAATEIQLVNKFGFDDMPIHFNANRPFLFYISDEDNDTILFAGKVMNPAL